MLEDSPRATKRRKLDGKSVVEESVTPIKTQTKRRATPRTYTRKSKVSAGLTEHKENDVVEVHAAVGDLAEGSPICLSQPPVSGDRENQEGVQQQGERLRMTANAIPDTGEEGRSLKVSSGGSSVDLDQEGEGSGQETEQAIEAGSTRASARQRKQTWKAAEPDGEERATKRAKMTPASLKRPTKKAVGTLTPVAKDPVQEAVAATVTPQNLAEAALLVVRAVSGTPTPTPRKRAGQARVHSTAPQADVQSSADLVAEPPPAIALAPTPTPKRRGRQPKEKGAVSTPRKSAKTAEPTAAGSRLDVDQDEVLLDSSPFKTTALNLTPTPRKRGRPPKVKVVDEFGFTAVDPLNTPGKRKRKTLAEEAEDVDPLAAFVRRDPATLSARKGAKDTPEKVKAVSWKDYKDDEAVARPQNDVQGSLPKLQELLDDEMFTQPLTELRAGILQALTGRRRMPLQGLDDEYQKVRQVVEQTVVAGEGNSMLVIGPRGCGKSALLESVIGEMTSEHPDEFHVIRLNGSIHTDDKLALREIWRQLGREMEVDDGTLLERSNYADTLASLLAVLSHPSEQDGTQKQQEGQAARSVVFIIDEFDLFTTHARQTLLYNLFDIAQARKAPIAVLGLTTRVDVTESLEKRVKSRFSHRSVFLPRPKSFKAFQNICLAALKASSDYAVPHVNAGASEQAHAEAYRTLHSAWSDYITSLFHESTAVSATLRSIYATSRSIPTALSTFLLPIAAFTSSAIPSDSDFASQALLPPDSKLDLLISLTDVELMLLIAAARLDIILNVDTCNFNMAYDEYVTLANRSRLQTSASGARALGDGSRTWSRATGLGAWEKLEILELIMPLATAGYGAGAGLADVGRSGKLMRCDVSLDEIRYSGVELSTAMMKWCKEI